MTLLLTTILSAQIILTDTNGLTIHACHDDDAVMVEVQPLNPNRVGGIFLTTNRVLRLRDLSMLPSGTNLLKMRTICAGSTSDVREATVVLRRPVPMPRIGVMTDALPPMPPGFVMPLPNSTNHASYQAYLRHLESGKRRSN